MHQHVCSDQGCSGRRLMTHGLTVNPYLIQMRTKLAVAPDRVKQCLAESAARPVRNFEFEKVSDSSGLGMAVGAWKTFDIERAISRDIA